MVRHFRGVLAAWPLVISVGCADDRISRSDGTAPNAEGSSGSTALPVESSADPGLPGTDKPGPIVANDGVSVGDGAPAGGGAAPDDDPVVDTMASGGDVTTDVEP